MALPSGHNPGIAEAIAASIMAGQSDQPAEMEVVSVKDAAPVHPSDVTSMGVHVTLADWCGHCKRFKPEMEKVRGHLAAYGSPLEFVVHSNPNSTDGVPVPLPPHLSMVRGFPTINAMVNRVIMPEYELPHGSAPQFLNSLRASFPEALQGVPDLPADLSGGAHLDVAIGFTPLESAPLFGGGRRRRRHRVTFGGGEAKSAGPESIEGGGMLRTMGRRIANLVAPTKATPEPAAPEPAAPAPSGGSVKALTAMPLAARCAIVTLSRMSQEVQSAFGPGSGATVERAMSAPAEGDRRSIVVVMHSPEGRKLVMAGVTPADGCNTLDGTTESGAAEVAVTNFELKYEPEDVTGAVADALGMA